MKKEEKASPVRSRKSSNGVRKEIIELIKERHRLEKNLLQFLSRYPLFPATFYPIYKACNKPGCKCTRGEKHGPYWYLSFRKDGKTKMVFVRQARWEKVKRLTDRYKRWRKIRARLVMLNKEILSLIDELEKTLRVRLKEVQK